MSRLYLTLPEYIDDLKCAGAITEKDNPILFDLRKSYEQSIDTSIIEALSVNQSLYLETASIGDECPIELLDYIIDALESNGYIYHERAEDFVDMLDGFDVNHANEAFVDISNALLDELSKGAE